jgi:hypothetical protein
VAIAARMSKHIASLANGASGHRRWLRHAVGIAAATATSLGMLTVALLLAITAFVGLFVGMVSLAWVLPKMIRAAAPPLADSPTAKAKHMAAPVEQRSRTPISPFVAKRVSAS